MTLPFLKSLQAGTTPPKVVLLPDALFFVRAVAITPGATPAEAAAQIELALETLSPFPPAQLYHGSYWLPGSERALVFAAYRRRFTTDQVSGWEGAELVIPAFAALLGSPVQPATAVIAPSAEGLTALYWENGPVPAKVRFSPLPPAATDEDRARLRDHLLREIGETRRVVDLTVPPAARPAGSDREFAFGAGDFSARLAGSVAAAADVRDRDELASLRRARARDVAIWRAFLAFAALLLLLGLGELALVGAGLWHKTRVAQAAAQRPLVEKIMTAQSISTRIRELSTRRLLPIEMILMVSARKPEAVTFLRTTTSGLYTLSVEAKSTSPAAVSSYQTALAEQPFAEKVEVRDQRSRDNTMTFTLIVTFRPAALAPAATAP